MRYEKKLTTNKINHGDRKVGIGKGTDLARQ